MAYDANKQKDHQDGNDPGYEDTAAYQQLLNTGYQPLKDPGAASGGPMAGAAGSPTTPTGYLDFDSYYNANAGTAASAANNLDKNVQGQATGAGKDLTNAYSQFTGAKQAGTPTHDAGPTDAQKNWAATGATGVDTNTKDITSAYRGNGNAGAGGDQSYNTETGQTLNSTPTRGGTGSSDPLGATRGYYDPKNPIGIGLADPSKAAQPDYESQVEAGASANPTYTGPNSLADTNAYAALTKDTTNAQTAVDNLGTNGGIQGLQGGNAFDAALTAAAGRPQFAYEQSKYGNGQLRSHLDQSVANSQADADKTRAGVTSDASQYQQLLDQYNGRKSADQAQVDAQMQKNANTTNAAQTEKNNKDAYDNYTHGSIGDQARNDIHAVGEAINPVDWLATAAGFKMPTTAVNDFLSPESSTNPGNRSPAWADGDQDVYASMTDSDWATFQGLTEDQQRDWIAARKAALAKKKSGG